MPKSSYWPPLYLHLAGFEYAPLFASVKSHCWSANQVDRKLLEMHFWLIVEFFGPQALQTLQAGVKLHLRHRVHFLLNKKCTLFIDNTTPKIQKVAINTGSKRKRDVWKLKYLTDIHFCFCYPLVGVRISPWSKDTCPSPVISHGWFVTWNERNWAEKLSSYSC